MILSQKDIFNIVSENKYKIDDKNRFVSRCSSGQYSNKTGLPALAIPGGDLGELAIIFATANSFGFEIDYHKSYKVFTDIIGGKDNLSIHIDQTIQNVEDWCKCSHIQELIAKRNEYNLTDEDIISLKKYGELDLHNNINTLEKEACDAVLIINGDYGVYPQYNFSSMEGSKAGRIYVFHKSLIDLRHRLLAEHLIEENAITFYADFDSEYVYEALSDTTDSHFLQSISTFNVPIYSINFAEDGTFEQTAV